ncbi:g9548 [Coccomyxa elongata]
MLSAATTIQETLQLAFQRQTQLLKDLTALQNDLALISHGHDASLTDDSKLGLFGDGHSIPGSCPEKGSVNSKDKAWASGFEQLAVQFVHAEVTALHAMHPSRIGGLALFAVAGTADGVLHFLDAQGNAVAKHDTGELQPISAIASHRLSRNESLVALGFPDGSVTTLKVHFSLRRAHRNAAEQGTIHSIAFERQLMVAQGHDEEALEVTHMVFLAPPRHSPQLVVARRSGHVDVWRRDGTLRMHFQVNDPVRLLKVTPRGALVVTAQGITSVLFPKDQPSSSGGSVLRPELVETTCQGLDGSIILSAAWAVSDHGTPQYDRVYALTGEGQLLVVVTQVGASQRCKVMSRTALHDSPITASIKTIRGYILLTTPDHVHVFKVNSTGLHEVITDFWGNLAPVDPAEERDSAPCLATSRYNLVVLDLGKGMIGMFKSKLPFREPVSLQRDSWKRPLFAIAMAIVGCWQFARVKGRRKLAGVHQQTAGLPEPGACVAREQGSVEDEDAEFAAEIRAVLREEQLRSENAACSGREAVPGGFGLAGGVYRGVNPPRLREYVQPDSTERQKHGSSADEDAEFAAEIRAALREEQLCGGRLSSSGREGGLSQVIHEGFSHSDGSYGGDRVGRPPETGGPLWADQGRLFRRRRGARAGLQNHQEQSQETDMDLLDEDIGPGIDHNAELSALPAAQLRARIDEVCAGNKRGTR